MATVTVSPTRVRVGATGFVVFRGPANVAVAWSTTGTGTITGSAATDAQGLARATYFPGTAGTTATITVTSGT